VCVGEPDQLGVERAHQQLAFGVRLVELAEPNRHVAADDDRPPFSLAADAVNTCSAVANSEHPDGSADVGSVLLATTVGMSVGVPDFDDAVPGDTFFALHAVTRAMTPTTTNPVRWVLP